MSLMQIGLTRLLWRKDGAFQESRMMTAVGTSVTTEYGHVNIFHKEEGF